MYLGQINLGVLDGWGMDVGGRSQTPLGALLGGKSTQREMQGQIKGCSGVDCNPKCSSAGLEMQDAEGYKDG